MKKVVWGFILACLTGYGAVHFYEKRVAEMAAKEAAKETVAN